MCREIGLSTSNLQHEEKPVITPVAGPRAYEILLSTSPIAQQTSKQVQPEANLCMQRSNQQQYHPYQQENSPVVHNCLQPSNQQSLLQNMSIKPVQEPDLKLIEDPLVSPPQNRSPCRDLNTSSTERLRMRDISPKKNTGYGMETTNQEIIPLVIATKSRDAINRKEESLTSTTNDRSSTSMTHLPLITTPSISINARLSEQSCQTDSSVYKLRNNLSQTEPFVKMDCVKTNQSDNS